MLKEKRALITGSASGIGLAIALAFLVTGSLCLKASRIFTRHSVYICSHDIYRCNHIV